MSFKNKRSVNVSSVGEYFCCISEANKGIKGNKGTLNLQIKFIHQFSHSAFPSFHRGKPYCATIYLRRPGVDNPGQLTALFVIRVNAGIIKDTNKEEGR